MIAAEIGPDAQFEFHLSDIAKYHSEGRVVAARRAVIAQPIDEACEGQEWRHDNAKGRVGLLPEQLSKEGREPKQAAENEQALMNEFVGHGVVIGYFSYQLR